MAQKKFSELEAGTVDGTSIFAQTKTEDGSLVSKSASSPSLAGYIGTSHQFAGLSTTAKNLVGAINEAASMGGVVQLTQAEYTALTTAEKMNGSIYKITDNAKMYCLDKEYHPVKELTTAQYEALSTAEQNNGTIYIQTDKETTGSDIPVSDSDATTIAATIGALYSKGVININRFVGSGYITSSRNYIDFSMPLKTKGATSIAVTGISNQSSYYPFSGSVVSSPFQISGSSVLSFTDDMVLIELRLSTQADSIQGCVVNAFGLQLTIS